jgi:hypothetical protein
VSQFLISSGAATAIAGSPDTVKIASFDTLVDLQHRTGVLADTRYYVFDQEIAAAQYLGAFSSGGETYADDNGVNRLRIYGHISQASFPLGDGVAQDKFGDYIFLRYENVVYNEIFVHIYPSGDLVYKNMDEITPFLSVQNKICDTGSASVYQII